jgi:SOS-response transcriptional repressor LexA
VTAQKNTSRSTLQKVIRALEVSGYKERKTNKNKGLSIKFQSDCDSGIDIH